MSVELYLNQLQKMPATNSEEEVILKNLQGIKIRIKEACIRANRNPDEVKLLLATKTVSVEKIRVAVKSGECLIGENKVQEGQKKSAGLSGLDFKYHFIGHLQSNKVKHVLCFADLIQSVDRISIAEKLQNRCLFENRTMDIFIQVNTSQESSKFGISSEKALEFIKQVSKLDRLKIKGLMTIGLLSSKSEKVRDCFKCLKSIQQQAMHLQLPGVDLSELSMGMSNDFEMAIEEGSTLVRIGTSIFGKRPLPDSYYWKEN